ncbi:UNVERIFIED_CONTAM: Secreted RxLR effector protein [Sesamum calycinum]|uniref:Secreted RxLR effector protein n=1 Tax=Sesamum calycinum TaxID=2727403 RepID=A0AAW2J622_9LAMI
MDGGVEAARGKGMGGMVWGLGVAQVGLLVGVTGGWFGGGAGGFAGGWLVAGLGVGVGVAPLGWLVSRDGEVVYFGSNCGAHDVEHHHLTKEPYVCSSLSRLDIAFVVGMLGRYQIFAGCVDSRKSTSGYIFMIVNGAVSWRNAKQTLIATSTLETEFVSYFEATSHGVVEELYIWAKNNRFNL